MPIEVTSSREITQSGSDTSLGTIPTSTTRTIAGRATKIVSIGSGAKLFFILNNSVIQTRVYINLSGRADGKDIDGNPKEAPTVGGGIYSDRWVAIDTVSSGATIETAINDLVAIANAQSVAYNFGFTYVALDSESFGFFIHSLSSLPDLSLDVGSSHSVELTNPNPTIDVSSTLVEGALQQVNFSFDDVMASYLFLKGMRFLINGDLTLSVGKNETLEIVTNGETEITTGEIEIAGTLNIIGASETTQGETSYASNVTISQVRIAPTTFSRAQTSLNVVSGGVLDIKSTDFNSASPVNILSGGTFNMEGGHIRPYQINLVNVGAQPTFIFSNGSTGTLKNIVVHQLTLFESYPTSSSFNIITSGARTLIIILNKTTEVAGVEGEYVWNAPSTRLDSGFACYGFPESTVQNTPQGVNIKWLIFRFLSAGVVGTSGVPFFQKIQHSVKSVDGSVATTGVLDTTDYNSGNRTNKLDFFNRATNELEQRMGFQDPTNLDENRDYSFAVTSSGDTNLLNMMILIVYKATDDILTHDYRIDGTTDNEHSFHFRDYGYLTQTRSVPVVDKGEDVKANWVRLIDTQVTKTIQTVSSLNKIQDDTEFYDFYKYISTRATTESQNIRKLDGFETDIITRTSGITSIVSGWDVEFIEGTNALPMQFNSGQKKISMHLIDDFTALTPMVFNGLEKPSDISLKGDITYTNSQNQTITNHTFSISAEAVDLSYEFDIHGILKSTGGEVVIQNNSLTGGDTLYVEIAKELYSQIIVYVHGGGADEETIPTDIDNFQFQNSYNIFIEGNPEEQWLIDYDNGIYTALNNSNEEIQIIGTWENLRALRLVWSIRHTISQYNKDKPASQRLNEDDYVTHIGNTITFLKKFTNTDFPKLVASSSEEVLFFNTANRDYLTQDIGIPSETSTEATSTVSGIQSDDIIKIQESNQPETLQSIISTGTSLTWVFTKSKTYTVRAYRNGFNSQILTISNVVRRSSFVFSSIEGVFYTGNTDLKPLDYFDNKNGEIELLQSTALSDDNVVIKSEEEINRLCQYNSLAPFGIEADHIIIYIRDGIVLLRYDMFIEAETTTSSETLYERVQVKTGSSWTDTVVDQTSEGITFQLENVNASSTLRASISYGVKARFIKTNGSFYADATFTGSPVSAGNDLIFSIEPGLDPASGDTNYRGKFLEYGRTVTASSDVTPTYITANQFSYETDTGSVLRVDGHISFLTRKTVSLAPTPVSVSVSGQYETEDRDRSIAIKTKVDSLENSEFTNELSFEILAGKYETFFIGFINKPDDNLVFGENLTPYKVFFAGRLRELKGIFISFTDTSSYRFWVSFEHGDQDDVDSAPDTVQVETENGVLTMQKETGFNLAYFIHIGSSTEASIINLTDGEKYNFKFLVDTSNLRYTTNSAYENYQFFTSEGREEAFKNKEKIIDMYKVGEAYLQGDKVGIIDETSGIYRLYEALKDMTDNQNTSIDAKDDNNERFWGILNPSSSVDISNIITKLDDIQTSLTDTAFKNKFEYALANMLETERIKYFGSPPTLYTSGETYEKGKNVYILDTANKKLDIFKALVRVENSSSIDEKDTNGNAVWIQINSNPVQDLRKVINAIAYITLESNELALYGNFDKETDYTPAI